MRWLCDRFLWGVLLTIVFTVACSDPPKIKPEVAGSSYSKPVYNLQQATVIALPATLQEISGISYQQADNSVFAIDDESGSLYKVSLEGDKKIEEWPFSKKRDYEDLAIWQNSAYVLESSGKLYSFSLSFPVKRVETHAISLKGKNEFEILFKDPAADRLLLMCKDCKEDSKNEVSIFAFDLQTKTFGDRSIGVVKREEIEAKLKDKTGRFKPSGADVHPVTGDIYIISSINKLLVVTNQKFTVKEVYPLDPVLFKQPEGVAFTASGDLLISNEAAGSGSANILMFKQGGQ